MKTLHLSIIFAAILAFFIPGISVEESITVSTDKSSYHYGDNYTISGKVSPVVPNEVVSILILSTNYQHPESLSVMPNSESRYSHTLSLPIKDISDGNYTIIAQYAGAKNQTAFSYTGLPCYQQNIPAHVYTAPIIRGPPAYNPRIIDSLGNAITGPVKVGQQIQITYTLANGLNCNQPFVYVVQIQDHNGITISLSWITGTLLAGQSFNPAQSWTPQYDDTYTAQIFLWQSLVNPNALAPPTSISFDVQSNANSTKSSHIVSEIPKSTAEFPTTVPNSPLKQFKSGIKAEDVKCNSGLILAIKLDYSPACVTKSSATKLFLRGWALGFTNYQTVYFMEPNSTAQIAVKYYPHKYQGTAPPDMSIPLHSWMYDLKSDYPLPSNEINAIAKPDNIHTNSITIVNYTIAAGNTKGVYWLSLLDPCVLIPIAVDLDETQLTTSDLQNPGDSKSCPAPEVQFHMVGVSNATLKLVQGMG